MGLIAAVVLGIILLVQYKEVSKVKKSILVSGQISSQGMQVKNGFVYNVKVVMNNNSVFYGEYLTGDGSLVVGQFTTFNAYFEDGKMTVVDPRKMKNFSLIFVFFVIACFNLLRAFGDAFAVLACAVVIASYAIKMMKRASKFKDSQLETCYVNRNIGVDTSSFTVGADVNVYEVAFNHNGQWFKSTLRTSAMYQPNDIVYCKVDHRDLDMLAPDTMKQAKAYGIIAGAFTILFVLMLVFK